MTYEFTEEQNAKLISLTYRMTILSYLLGVMGIFVFISFFLNNGGYEILLKGLLLVLFAITLRIPTDNFRRIVNTKGNDMKELIIGFKEIKTWSVYANIIITLLVAIMTVQLFFY